MIEHHDMSHHGKTSKNSSNWPSSKRRKSRSFADFLSKLKATDRKRTPCWTGRRSPRAIWATPRPTCDNLPSILLAGGGFRHAGHVAYDAKDNMPFSNISVRMLQQLGIRQDHFRQQHQQTGRSLTRPEERTLGLQVACSAQNCASCTSTSVACTISSSEHHSSGECGLCSPVDKFGVGSPSSVKREPSVPPRTMVNRGSRPSRWKACCGEGDRRLRLDGANTSAMLRYCGFHDNFHRRPRGNSVLALTRAGLAAGRPVRPAWWYRNPAAESACSLRPRRRRCDTDARSLPGRR